MNQTYQPFAIANYTQSTNPAYVGNPFIEALGDLPDDKAIAQKLTKLPKINPNQHTLPVNHRIDLLSDLHGLCIPFPRLVNLARSIFKLMREGYSTRRPYSSADNEKVRELFGAQRDGCEKWLLAPPRRVDLARQMSMALIGASGCGKSFGLSQISGMFPEVIYHEKYGRWQLPFVFVEMSYDGESVHTLATELFRELDRLLPDCGYSSLYVARQGLNAQLRLAKALALCYEHGVGALVVDEAQNQRGIGNEKAKRATHVKSETPLMKLLVTASNTSHMPLVMSGTMEMQGVVGARFTRLRRMCGNGTAQWNPLARSEGAGTIGEFEMMMMALWRYQYVKNPIVGKLTPEWADQFFNLTMGVPDILCKLWSSVQEVAISTGVETLTHELVENVFKAQFSTVALPLKALREDNQSVLSSLTDLYLSNDEQPLVTAKSRPAKKVYPSPTATAVSVVAGSGTDIRAPQGVPAPDLNVSRWEETALS